MPCYHKPLKEEKVFELQKQCPQCLRNCSCCVDCNRWILQDTADQYDGERCSRCFDKYLQKNKKGIFADKPCLEDYGNYRNEIEWNQKSHRYTKFSKMEIYREQRKDYKEWKNQKDEDYEYNDFCVPDDFVEYVDE